MNKIKVFHFHNGSGGGVLSVIKNLLKYSNNLEIENHLVYTINKDLVPGYDVPVIEGATTVQLFYYSAKWNFYYTCRQLAKLLSDDKAVVVAHDWLELGMMSNLGLQNPVVQVVHGNYDYYYELAQKHSAAIDQYICISPVIYNKLCAALPQRTAAIQYCRFPVPFLSPIQKNNERLKVFYCVRSLNDENKQFRILPLINQLLKQIGIKVDWTIIGKGIEEKEVNSLMDQQEGMDVFADLTNEEVLALLPLHDLFILPSLKEGFPVAVVEAMKGGLVPLISDWEGATAALVEEGETGYYFKTGDAGAYAKRIISLERNRALLSEISDKCSNVASNLFEPSINTNLFEAMFIKAATSNTINKTAQKIYGSRLDQPWLGNTITNTIRNTFSKSSN